MTEELLVGYKGDEAVGVFTAEEWARRLGISRDAVMSHATPSWERRCGGKRGLVLVRTGVAKHGD